MIVAFRNLVAAASTPVLLRGRCMALRQRAQVGNGESAQHDYRPIHIAIRTIRRAQRAGRIGGSNVQNTNSRLG